MYIQESLQLFDLFKDTIAQCKLQHQVPIQDEMLRWLDFDFIGKKGKGEEIWAH